VSTISGIELTDKFSSRVTDLFAENKLDIDKAKSLVHWSLSEDTAPHGDVTSLSTISESSISIAVYRARKEGVIVGISLLVLALESVGLGEYELLVSEGENVKPGHDICIVTGSTRAILLIERTSLNIVGHLSGIATSTHRWVSALEGYKTQVRDTRKTTPLFRELEKFAVKKGGGTNHRFNLSDQGLIKDNHIAAAGSITSAFNSFKAQFPHLPVEIEVDTLDQFNEALALNPTYILLDNMSPEQCKQAVLLNTGNVLLEASGGIVLDNAVAYAQSGVDFISVGAITNSAPVLDIGLDFESSAFKSGSKAKIEDVQ
jgi:nicotinate-nucleotide pyrophosphorylase (carboxylating)